MKRNLRLPAGAWIFLLACLLAAPVAMAAGRSIDQHTVYIGKAGTRVSHDFSFRMSYLEVKGEKGRLDTLHYQISSLKDARLVLRDVQFLARTEDAPKLLWAQSSEEKMGMIIDNLDPDPKVVKVYTKRKFFTQEVPFDLDADLVRWLIEIAGKVYAVDWDLKTNQVSCGELPQS